MPVNPKTTEDQRAEEAGYDAGRAGMVRQSSDPHWLRGWDKGNGHRQSQTSDPSGPDARTSLVGIFLLDCCTKVDR